MTLRSTTDLLPIGEQSQIGRRDALKCAAGMALGGTLLSRPRHVSAAGVSDQYAGLDSAKYLGAVKIEVQVKDSEIFTEGPAADAHGNVYFTNVPVEKILKWDGKSLTEFRTGSRKANGLLFEPDGSLLACEGGAGQVSRTNLQTGELSIIASEFNGFGLGAPNDLTRDSAGRIYFTSRLPNDNPQTGNVNAVYRIDPDGSLHQVLQLPDTHMPNGIVISPDERTLYLIEAHPDADRNRCILAFDLQSDGTLRNARTLIDFYPGRSGDGMCIDAAGNLYVAAGLHKTRRTSETLDTRPGIHVISPDGRLLAFVETPEDTITNCTFGDADLKTLYITCGSLLLSVRTTIPGRASYRPKA